MPFLKVKVNPRNRRSIQLPVTRNQTSNGLNHQENIESRNGRVRRASCSRPNLTLCLTEVGGFICGLEAK